MLRSRDSGFVKDSVCFKLDEKSNVLFVELESAANANDLVGAFVFVLFSLCCRRFKVSLIWLELLLDENENPTLFVDASILCFMDGVGVIMD